MGLSVYEVTQDAYRRSEIKRREMSDGWGWTGGMDGHVGGGEGGKDGGGHKARLERERDGRTVVVGHAGVEGGGGGEGSDGTSAVRGGRPRWWWRTGRRCKSQWRWA